MELKDTVVTVTCLMPGATETEFFAARYDGYQSRPIQKAIPADVASLVRRNDERLMRILPKGAK